MKSLLNGTMFWNHGKMLLLFVIMPETRKEARGYSRAGGAIFRERI